MKKFTKPVFSVFLSQHINNPATRRAPGFRRSMPKRGLPALFGMMLLLALSAVSTQSYAARTMAFSGGGNPPNNICQGATDVLIYSFQGASGSTSDGITSWTFTTTGSALSGTDIVNFKFWRNTTNSLTGATQLGPTLTTTLGAGSHPSGTFTSVNYSTNTTNYYFVTATIAPTATIGATLAVSGYATTSTTNPFTWSNTSVTISGSTFDGGTMTVSAPPTIASLIGSPNPVCTGQLLTLTSGATAGTGAITTYTWKGPNAYSATSATNSTTFTPATTAASGLYSVTVTYTGLGCTSAAATSNITVNQTPTISTLPTSAISCSGGNVSSVASGGTTYLWNPGSVASPTITVAPGSATVYTVTGTTLGCSSTATFNVTLSTTPTVTYSTQPGGSICGYTNATYTTQPGMTGYTWSIPGTSGTDYNIISGGTSADNSTVIEWLTGGSKTVTVNYISAGCAGAAPASNTTVVAGPPTLLASGVSASVVTATTATINWTTGNGNGRIVVINPTYPIASAAVPPTNNGSTSYTANASYGTGSATGTNNFVVYSGSGSTVAVTNLAPTTTYTATVYEYNNGSGCWEYSPGASTSFTTQCNGTPSVGASAVTPGSGNGSTLFSLSLPSYTFAASTGITYQWQSSADGVTGWTDIPTATTATFGFTGISANTFYRCKVTCTLSSSVGYSDVSEAVLLGCVTTAASWLSFAPPATFDVTSPGSGTWQVPGGVTSVTLDVAGAAGASGSGTAGNGGEAIATFAVTPLQTLYYYIGSTGSTTAGGSSFGGGEDGGAPGSAGTYNGGGGAGSDVRTTAGSSVTRLIVGGGGGGGQYDCAQETGGNGGNSPTAGTGGGGADCNPGGAGATTSGPGAGGCGDVTANGGATGQGGSGVTGTNCYTGAYKAGGGGGYYGGGGAPTAAGGGGLSYATSVGSNTLTGSPTYNDGNNSGGGYLHITWSPPGGNDPSYGINAFSVTAATGANLNDVGMVAATTSSTGYLDRTSLTPIVLYTGNSYASSVTWGVVAAYQEAQVWIDFNNNGTYEPSEEVSAVVGYSSVGTISPTIFNITIPAGAATGNHLMRVRGIEEYSGGTLALSSHLDPCLSQYGGTGPQYNYGNAVDYIVTVRNTPVATVSPTSLNFGTIGLSTTSASQTFSITANYLSPSPGNLTVSAPANYNVSLTGTGGWGSTVSVPYTGGALSGFPVYVQFVGPGTTGVYSGSVTVTGGLLPAAVNVAVTGAVAAPCSGSPAAGTASVTPGSGAGTTVFTLNNAGFTLGLGISYQWQSSPNGVTGWTNIPGATTVPYTFTGITANTFYQCITTCSSGPASNTSSVCEAILLGCATTASSWDDDVLNTVNFTTVGTTVWPVPAGVVNITGAASGANGSSGNGTGGTGGYIKASLTVPAGVTSLSINVGGKGVGTTGGTNGGGTGNGGYSGGGGGGASDIRISGTALANRVLVAGGGGGNGDYANGGNGGGLTGGSGAYGAGGGTQLGGGAGDYGAGNGGPGVGGAGGYYGGGGGGGYYGGGGGEFDGGGGGSSYSSGTILTNTSGGSVGTAGNGKVTITYYLPTPPNLPTYGINAFTVTAATGANLSDAGMVAATTAATGYLDRTALTPVVLYTGNAYASTVTWGTATAYQEAQVWIDFNDNGYYEPSEEVTGVVGYSAASTTSPTTFNITIPGGAALGNHLMRVRGIVEDPNGTLALSTHLDPCLNQYGGTGPSYNYGNATDYVVTIRNTPVATATPALNFGTILTSTTSASQTFSITANYLYPASGNLTVTAPANYNVSLNGTTWATSVSVPYTGGALTNYPVYVEFIAPATSGTYNSNVGISGGLLPATVNLAVTGAAANACSGTPAAGTANITPGSGNGTTVFTLDDPGFSLGVGIGYQWQSSADGVTGWTNISGASTIPYTFTGITANTYYRCVSTCSFSGLSNNSSVTEAILMGCTTTVPSWAGIAPPGLFNAPAAPSNGTWSVPAGVTQVSITVAGGAGGPGGTYSTYDGLGAVVTGTFAVTPLQNLYYYAGAAGTIGTSFASSSGGGEDGGHSGPQTFFTSGGGAASDVRTDITGGATSVGSLASRLIVGGGGGGGIYDCFPEVAGGNAGTGGSGANGVVNCGGTAPNGGSLSAQGTSTNGATAGATTACGGGGTGTYMAGGGGGYYGGGGSQDCSGAGGSSIAHTIGTNTLLGAPGYSATNNAAGYVTISWTPPPGNQPSYGIDAFSVTAATGSNLGDAGMVAATTASTGYLNRLSLTPIVLYTGGTYASSVTWGAATSYQEAQVWIDFNNNGFFEPSEEVTGVVGYSASSTTSPTTFNVSIPAGAATGNHLMRVRGIVESSTGTLALSTHLDPCLQQYGGAGPIYNYGNAADYVVTIRNTPTVTAGPTLNFGTILTSATSASQTFSITASALYPASGNLTVTAPANYNVSLNGTTWSTSVSVPYTSGTLTNYPIYVEFIAPGTAGTYNGNVAITGGLLASTVNVAVTGAAASPCSGTPNAGTANVTPGSGNGTTVFTLDNPGFSLGVGITYQWQSSLNGATGWTNIAGATTIPYTFTGITANTYYRCVSSCSFSSLSNNSSVCEAILLGCTPSTASWSGLGSASTFNVTTPGSGTWVVPAGVSSVQLDVAGANGGGAGSYHGGYGGEAIASFTVTPTQPLYYFVGASGVAPGAGGSSSGGGEDGGNGSLTGFSAYDGGGGGAGSDVRTSIAGGGTSVASLASRLIAGGGGGGGIWPSDQQAGGDGGNPGATGPGPHDCTPAGAGATTSGPGAGGCGDATANGGTGFGGSGIYAGTYRAGGGGGYYGGGGATHASGGGGLSLAVGYIGTPTYNNGVNTGAGYLHITWHVAGVNQPTYGINAFNVTAATGPNLADAGMVSATTASTGYLDRTSLTPIILYENASYAASATWGTGTSYQELQVWIDFNSDGYFTPDEEVTGVLGYSTTSTVSPTTFNINIPCGVATGNHLMRIRGIVEDPTGTLALSSHLDPCLNQYGGTGPKYNYGNVADYVVNVQNAPCSGTPVAGASSASATLGCNSLATTLSLTGASTCYTGLSYKWQSSPNGSGYTDIPGATTVTYSVTPTATTFYQCVVTCSVSALSNIATQVTVTVNALPALAPTATPTSACVGGTITLADNATGGAGYAVAWTGPTTGIASASAENTTIPSAVPANAGTFTVTATAPGCPGSVVGSTSAVTVSGPSPFGISYTGGTCEGAGGLVIHVAGSSAANTYQLRLAGSNIGSGVAGGGTLSFPSQTAAGGYDVVATDLSGCPGTISSNTITVVGVPGNVSGLSTTGTTGTATTATFTAPGTAPTGYIMVASTGALVGGPTVGQPITTGTAVGSNGTIVGVGTGSPIPSSIALTQNTNYTITIFSYNTTPTCTGGPVFSSGVNTTVTTCAATPVVTTGTVGSNSIGISFNSAAGGSAGTYTYTLKVCTDGAMTVPAPGFPADNSGIVVTSPFTIPFLTSNTTYYFTVTADNGFCTATSSIGNATTTAGACGHVFSSPSSVSASYGDLSSVSGTVKLLVNMKGASGGIDGGGTGVPGNGGAVVCTLTVVAPTTLNVYVGGTGGNGANCTGGAGCPLTVGGTAGVGGSTGGAGGNAPAGASGSSGGGGGGSSEIRTSDGTTLIVASGGGGAGGNARAGGAGGGGTSGAGVNGTGGGTSGGGTGAPAGGGSGGAGGTGSVNNGIAGTLASGGAGGAGSPRAGGGGGGGYWGGGGGGAGSAPASGGGGGGANYVSGAGVSGVTTNGSAGSAGNGSVTITILPPNVQTVTGGGSRCSDGAALNIGLASTDLSVIYELYYNGVTTGATVSGTGVAMPNAFTGLTAGGAYTVVGYYNGLPCTSTPMANTVNINVITPTIISTTPGVVCTSGTTTLTATPSAGATVNWYANATGGPSLGSGNSFVTPSISATAVYYADATNGVCVTPTRTAVTATVVPTPSITGTIPSSTCGSGTVTLGATASAGTINWYVASSGGSSLATGTSYTPSISATTTYYVDVTYNVCVSPTRTPVTATSITIPTITGTTPGTICNGGTVALGATSDVGTVSWYAAAIGGPALTTGTSYTPSVSATTTYYVDANNSGCITASRTSVTVTVNSVPAHTITGGGTYCTSGTGVPIGLDGSESGISYELYKNGSPTGNIQLGSGGTVDFGLITAAGDYTAVATNIVIACSSPMTGSTTVSVSPTPIVHNVTGGGNYCSGGSGVDITLLATDNVVTYQLFNNGVAVSGLMSATGGASIDFGSQTATGTYTVIANPGSSCATQMNGNPLVSILAAPGTILGTTSACIGSTTILSDASAGLGTWSSSTPSVATVDPANGTVSGVALGSSVISFTLSSTGCTKTTTVTVNATPVAITGAPATLCVGATTALSDGSVGQWTSGNTSVFTIGSSSGVVTAVGPGTATVAYTVGSGCAATSSITVNALPTVASIGAIPGTSYCTGATMTLTAGAKTGTGTFGTYNWSGPSAYATTTTGNSTSLILSSVAAAGNYSVTVTYAGIGCTSLPATLPVPITVNTAPTLTSASNNGPICSGSDLVLNANGGANVTSYSWAGPVAITSGANSATAMVSPGSAGIYTVTVNNGSGSGCAVNYTTTGIVNALAAAVTVSGSGGPFCGSTVLSAANGGSGTIYFQGITSNGTSTVTPAVLQTVSASGTYYFRALSLGGCWGPQGSATVSINALPFAYNITGGGSYCTGGSGVTIGLSGSETGVSYQLYNGVLPAVGVPPVMGTGSSISFGTISPTGNYTAIATNTLTLCTNSMAGSTTVDVTSTPNLYTVIGGGSYCVSDTGVHIGLTGSDAGVAYQLYHAGVAVGSLVTGTGSAIDLGLQTATGTYSVVASPYSACATTMTGGVSVSTNASPTPYTVTGAGSYCPGNPGLHVGLSNSQSTATYQLYKNGVAVGGAVSGTGFPLDFGLQTAGTYSVSATTTSTGCTGAMTGTVVLATSSVPTAYPVTGGGSYCLGGTGVHIGLGNSASGINYQLYNASGVYGVAVGGTGSAIDLGLVTAAGTYTVVATDASTFCTSVMLDTAVVVVGGSAPNPHSVVGGGTECANGLGFDLGLDGSDVSVSYQLYNESGPVGGLVPGTGHPLDMGLQLAQGTYTVVADPGTTCALMMTGTATIVNTPLPTPFTVTGGGVYCSGGPGFHIGLNGSETGVTYQLYKGSTAMGSPVAGTTGTIDFGVQTDAGTYKVVATSNSTSCADTMTDSAVIVYHPTAALHTVTGGGAYCQGGNGVDIGLAGSDVGVTYQLYLNDLPIGSIISGTGLAIDFGNQTVAGQYAAVANPASSCATTMTNSVTVTVNPTPTQYTLSGGGGYCAGSGGLVLSLDGSQTGISYQLYDGSTVEGTPVLGTGSGISFGAQGTGGTYSVLATNTTTGCFMGMGTQTTVTVDPLPTVYAVTGGGSYCAGGTGVHIGLSGSASGVNYKLYNGTIPVGISISGSGSSIDFGLLTTSGTYTVSAIDASSMCSSSMSGSAVVTVNPLPTVYNVGGGGHYCAGSTGPHITLSGSSTGVNYQLYTPTGAAGLPVAGTNAPLDFGAQTTSGTYSVVATSSSGCQSTMSLTANVTIDPLPDIYAVTGGGSYCAGGTGVHVGVSSSTTGIIYELYPGTLATNTVTGTTGNPVDFGYVTAAGTYSVVAIDGTSACTSNMSGIATVTINALPTAYTVSGTGSYCAGGAGLHVTLSGSATGISYQLYNNGLVVGTPVNGTNASLDFGLQTAAGTYSVLATNNTTGCTNAMASSAIITVNAQPVTYTVTGGGHYCAGGTGVLIGTDNSTSGISYQLYNGIVPVGSPVVSAGGPVSFGLQTAAGTYSVIASNTGSGCQATMSGNAVVTVDPLPLVYTVLGGGTYCAGGSGYDVTLSGSNLGINYQLYHDGIASGSVVPGTGSGIDMGMQSAAGVYTVTATDATSGCSDPMNGSATIIVNTAPAIYTVTGGGHYCSGGTGVHIGVSQSSLGINYQLYNGSTLVATVPGVSGGAAIDFGLQTAAGTYTVAAVNSLTGCTSAMSGYATVSIDPLPVVYNMSGNGSYCAGGPGVDVSLNNSNTGINYQLYRGITIVGSPIAGSDGNPIHFGNQTIGGVYSVIASNATTGCTSNMSGTTTVTVNPLPTVFTVTGGGSYCQGGTGVLIGQNSSSAGVTYQLLNGGSVINTLSGTNSSLNFGLQTTGGTYTVVATSVSTGCVAVMSGNPGVTINPLPTPYTVSGTGSYCSNTPGVDVTLSNSDNGISYQLYNGSAPVGVALNGVNGLLDFGLQTAGTYTVMATNSATTCTSNMSGSAIVTVNAAPSIFSVTGGGGYCQGGTGVHVGLASSTAGITYALFLNGSSTGSTVTGTGSAIDFGLQTAAGTYTVSALNTGSGCSADMSGSAVVTINPLPDPYAVYNSGGTSYCAGGAGVDIAMTNSEIGVNYQLIDGSFPVGFPVAGTGAPLDFGMQTTAGTYIVYATTAATTCSAYMSGSASVVISPLPTVYTVTGGGGYCTGDAGVHIGLSASNGGINYQLYRGSTLVNTVAGGSGAIDFGYQTTAGTYSVVAVNGTTSCTSNMAGTATVTVNSLPAQFTVTGGGNYCAGSSGVHVGLAGSATGVNYQLYNGITPVGFPVVGTGSALDFGLQTGTGTYTVIASNTLTTCTKTMTGSVTVGISSVPAAYTVTGGGDYCSGGSGVSISLLGSSLGVNYQLYNGITPGTTLVGTGSSLNYGLLTTAGTYMVVATDTTTHCQANMSGSAAVVVDPLPVVFNVTGGGSYCAGDTGIHVTLSGSQTGVNYQLYNGSSASGFPVAGTGSLLDLGLQTTVGTYTVMATNATTGCVKNMSGSTTVSVNPILVPSVAISTGMGDSVCYGGTTTLTAMTTNGGSSPAYQWQVNGAAVGSSTGSYAYVPNNGDVITVTMTSNATCARPATVNSSINLSVLPHGAPIVSIAALPGNEVCIGSAATYTATPTFGGTAPVYTWVKNGTPVTGVTGPTYGNTPNNGDIIFCMMSSNYPCRTADSVFSNTLTMKTDTPMLPSVTIAADPSNYVGAGTSVTLTAVVTNAGVNPHYQWYVGNYAVPGAIYSTLTSSDFADLDSVSCVVTSSNACQLSTFNSIIMHIWPLGVTQITSGDGDIALIPNPNKGQFTIKGTLATTADQEVSYELTDMLGQVVYKNKVMVRGGNLNEAVQLSGTLANGMYLLSLHTADGMTRMFHVVVEQ